MICPNCGAYAGVEEILCPDCGALLPQENKQENSIRAIRQGRRGAEGLRNYNAAMSQRKGSSPESAAAEEHPRPGSRSAGALRQDTRSESLAGSKPSPMVYAVREDDRQAWERTPRRTYEFSTVKPEKMGRARKRAPRINWMIVLLAVIVLGIGAMAGGYLYLKNTPEGQKILARFGREVPASALWAVGKDELDQGNVEEAIEYFNQARLLDEAEDTPNVAGLLELGSTYESLDMLEEAEAIYTDLYTNIVPSQTDAYSAMIRILEKQSRLPEAAELMKLAYEKTGQTSYNSSRDALLPQKPTAGIAAGYYTWFQSLTLSSPQDYDVYYTFDPEAELPAGGTRYTEPLYLSEGTWDLRAVAVRDELASDEFFASYKVYLKAPEQPRSSLAPNTYSKKQRVWLKLGANDAERSAEEQARLKIYYTIDGSIPNADSPVYDGEPFWLPTGCYVTLRAVVVNEYGKVSNMMEVKYKVDAKPYPQKMFDTQTDTVPGITLFGTTREQFFDKYGQGEKMEEILMADFDGLCQKYTYGWGFAVFAHSGTGWRIVELNFTSSQFSGPRDTAVGNTEEYVTGRFRDMGQVASPSGNRYLYNDDDDAVGKITAHPDGTRTILYTDLTADSHEWFLSYEVNASGTVEAIDFRYVP